MSDSVIPFTGTKWTHEIVINGERVALVVDFNEAKVVARALSRVTRATLEVRVYAAYASTPKTSFRGGDEVR